MNTKLDNGLDQTLGEINLNLNVLSSCIMERFGKSVIDHVNDAVWLKTQLIDFGEEVRKISIKYIIEELLEAKLIGEAPANIILDYMKGN